jgi:hypothetical protein
VKNEALNETTAVRYDASRDGAVVEKFTYDAFGQVKVMGLEAPFVPSAITATVLVSRIGIPMGRRP